MKAALGISQCTLLLILSVGIASQISSISSSSLSSSSRTSFNLPLVVLRNDLPHGRTFIPRPSLAKGLMEHADVKSFVPPFDLPMNGSIFPVVRFIKSHNLIFNQSSNRFSITFTIAKGRILYPNLRGVPSATPTSSN